MKMLAWILLIGSAWAQYVATIPATKTSSGSITFVNSSAFYASGTNPQSVTISIASGHAIIAMVTSIAGNEPYTMSDSNSDTFTSAIGPINEVNSGTTSQIFCAIAGAAVTSVSFHVVDSGGNWSGVVYDVSGISSCTADKTNDGLTTSSGTYSSGASGTTSNANELLVGFLVSKNSNCTWSSIGANLPNNPQSRTTSPSVLALYGIVSSTGSYTASATCSDSGSYGVSLIATFH